MEHRDQVAYYTKLVSEVSEALVCFLSDGVYTKDELYVQLNEAIDGLNMARAACDICGQVWSEDHICPSADLEDEIAFVGQLLESLPYSPIDTGEDDQLSDRLGWLHERVGLAWNKENAI